MALGCGPQEKFADIGPASVLNLAHVDPSGYPADLTQVIQLAGPVARIRMAKRAVGGWIVWALAGGAELSGGPLSGFPKELDQTFQILPQTGALVPSSFDVEPIGDLLAVAFASRVPGDVDEVEVVAVDASGAAKWSASIPTGGQVDGALSLRAAPDGSTLLVAWSELAAGASAHRLRIARLTCVPAP